MQAAYSRNLKALRHTITNCPASQSITPLKLNVAKVKKRLSLFGFMLSMYKAFLGFPEFSFSTNLLDSPCNAPKYFSLKQFSFERE